jgi:REP element-mobilizing transposase RayT
MNDDTTRSLGVSLRLKGFDYSSADYAYFVTLCADQGDPFAEPELARSVLATLDWLRAHRGIAIYAFCLMPDHLHLLLRLAGDGKTLGDVVRSMKLFTTRRSWQLGHDGQLWQDRFYDHVVRRSENAQATAEYIRQNPVRRGLVHEPEEYPWSGFPDPM